LPNLRGQLTLNPIASTLHSRTPARCRSTMLVQPP
jgi:hypothetical protein